LANKIERGEVVERRAHVAVVKPQRFLAESKGCACTRARPRRSGPASQGLGLAVAALVLVERGEAVERGSHVDRAQRRLTDGKAALEQGLGLGVETLRPGTAWPSY
jgi:hypothetical protein